MNNKEPKNKLMKYYLEYFNEQSVYNKMYGRISCHSLIGGLTRHIKIKIGKYYDDNRINFFYVAPSGTGKTTGANVYVSIIEALNMKVHELDDFTDASVAGTVQHIDVVDDENRYQKMITETESILESNDFIHSDEASLLLSPNRHSMKSVIFIQKACNPIGSAGNKIVRTLASGQVETTSECTFMFTTFPPQNKRDMEVMVENGLLQRMAFYPRSMDISMFKNMSEKMIDGFFGDDELDIKSKEFYQLVVEFEKIQDFYRDIKRIPIHKKMRPYIKKKVSELYNHLIENNIRYEVRKLMYTYINRYLVLIIKFATHNVIMNYGKRIMMKDLKYGWNIVFEMFKMATYWIDEQLPKNFKNKNDENDPHQLIYNSYRKILKKNGYKGVSPELVPRKELILKVKTMYGMSRTWFDNNIGELVGFKHARKNSFTNRVYFEVYSPIDKKTSEKEMPNIMEHLDLDPMLHD